MASVAQAAKYMRQAETALEQAATCLGQIGAPPEAVKTVTQMASVARKVENALSKQNVAEAEAKPAPGQEPAAAPAGPGPEVPTGRDEAAQPRSIGEATDQYVEERRKRVPSR